jgi:hypothetical protein
MPEIACLSGNNDWIDLDFVERERTPEPAMKLGIQIHLAGLSLSNTISAFDSLVSNALGKRSTIGYRRPIYSRSAGRLRIRLRLMKR